MHNMSAGKLMVENSICEKQKIMTSAAAEITWVQLLIEKVDTLNSISY